VKRVKGLLAEVFPLVELTEVLIAIDGATGFSERLLHAANSRSPAMLVHLYAAILARATNLGPVAMARSSGLSYDQVAHATAWYLRHETHTAAIDDLVNYHHHLPVGLDYSIRPGATFRAGSSLSDFLRRLPGRASFARLSDGAGPA